MNWSLIVTSHLSSTLKPLFSKPLEVIDYHVEFTDRYCPSLWINLSLAYIMEYSYHFWSHQFSINHIFLYWAHLILYGYWRNIFSYKAFICKLSIDSVYIRTLYLQRSFLGCLCILGPITIFYARSFYNIFYTSIFGVWSTTSFMIPNFIFSLDHLSLSTINPWRFL